MDRAARRAFATRSPRFQPYERQGTRVLPVEAGIHLHFTSLVGLELHFPFPAMSSIEMKRSFKPAAAASFSLSRGSLYFVFVIELPSALE